MCFGLSNPVNEKFLLAISVCIISGLLIGILTLPSPGAKNCMTIFSSDGQLLGAHLAQDEQMAVSNPKPIVHKIHYCSII